MGDKIDYMNNPHLISKFTDVGISQESLASAAATAKQMCIQSRALNGGALDPCNHTDYQHLFLELAQKTEI